MVRATHIIAHNAATWSRCAISTSLWERHSIAAWPNTHLFVPDAGKNPNRKTITSNAAQSLYIKWQIALLSTLRKQMEKTNTDEYLQEAILDCINSTLADRAVNMQGPFQQVLESQEQIHWVGMLCGCWTKQLQIEYEKSYDAPPDESRKDKNKPSIQMARWQKKIIQTIWGSLIKLWKTRNDESHGWDKESWDSARREVLHMELQEIYDQKHEYPQRIQRLLRATYEIHIQETVTKLADWLDAYKGTFAVTWSPD
jgi:hypothetical protein